MYNDCAFRIGGFTFEPVKRQVTLGTGEVTKLRPEETQVLMTLIEYYPNVLTRKKLEEVVWPGVIVTDNAVNQVIKDLRKSIGDHICDVIKTVPRWGYHLSVNPEMLECDEVLKIESESLGEALRENEVLPEEKSGHTRVDVKILFISLSVLLAGFAMIYYFAHQYISVNIIAKRSAELPLYSSRELVKQMPESIIGDDVFFVKEINGKKVTCALYKGGTLCKAIE